MGANKVDLQLLKNNPGELIVKYQDLINAVIHNFYKSGFIGFNDKDDFLQYVNLELLKKTGYIAKKYNGSSPLKIYLMVIIRNLCYEKLRKERKYENEINEESVIEKNEPENITSNIVIKQELDFLDKILKTFHKKRNRILLCLKFIFRIKVTEEDFKKYNHEVEQMDIQGVIEETCYTKSLTDKDICSIITPFLNKYERKNNSSDTIRKWISLKINDLIDLMNGNPPRAKYNKETIQILFEKYIENKYPQ